MSGKLLQNDEEIRQKLEDMHKYNKKWMPQKQYEFFIDYKLHRENIGDVLFDTEFLVNTITDLHNKKVLDVGCGAGDLVINLARRGIDVKGVDMSKDDIEVAKLKASKYGLNKDKFYLHDGSAIPFQDASFDVITCIEVLEHTGKYYIEVLEEIFRLLRTGGMLYLTIPNKWCPYDTHLYTWVPHWLPKSIRIPYLNKIRGEKARSENYLLDYNFFSYKEIEKILSRFTNTNKMDINKKYMKYYTSNLNAVEKSTNLRSKMKNGFIKLNRISSLHNLLMVFFLKFYFFQSIKILAEK